MKEIKKLNIFVVVFLTMMLFLGSIVTTMAEEESDSSVNTETPQKKKSELEIIY